MSNKHIKTINGRKYYYESIRKGKKVTSRYLGPVERIRARKRTAMELEESKQQEQEIQEMEKTEETEENANYIG